MKQAKRFLCMALTLLILCSTLALPTYAAGNIMYGIGFVDATGLRLRSQPNTNSQVLDIAGDEECVVVIGLSGSWYHVIYNLQEGYMHKSYLEVLTRENAELGYGRVTGSTVNLRSGPSTNYGVVDRVDKGDELYIIGLNQGWYKVIHDNRSCYIRSDYLKLTEYPYENADSSNSPQYFRHGKSIGASVPGTGSAWGGSTGSNSGSGSSWASGSSQDDGSSWGFSSVTGRDIVAEAQKYLGTPYAAGGATPAGFDCSGFTYYVLKSLGYSPNRTPQDQYSHGRFVSKGDLEPGDLVFFSGNGGSSITHVGIYAGNGEFIHSPNSRSTVSYSDLTSGYWANTYYGARRVV